MAPVTQAALAERRALVDLRGLVVAVVQPVVPSELAKLAEHQSILAASVVLAAAVLTTVLAP